MIISEVNHHVYNNPIVAVVSSKYKVAIRSGAFAVCERFSLPPLE